MSTRDSKFFNCSEKHEIDHVCSRYLDKEGVKAFLHEKCKDGTIKYWSHDKLYAFLEENGFKRA